MEEASRGMVALGRVGRVDGWSVLGSILFHGGLGDGCAGEV